MSHCETRRCEGSRCSAPRTPILIERIKIMKTVDLITLAIKNGYSFEELQQLKEWEKEELMEGEKEKDETEEQDPNTCGTTPAGTSEAEEGSKPDGEKEKEETEELLQLKNELESLKKQLKEAQEANKHMTVEKKEEKSAFERMMEKARR